MRGPFSPECLFLEFRVDNFVSFFGVIIDFERLGYQSK